MAHGRNPSSSRVWSASFAIFQRQITHVAPAVGLAPEKRDAMLQRGCQCESAEIRRQRRERQFIDGAMPLVIPRAGVEGERAERGCQCEQYSFHNQIPAAAQFSGTPRCCQNNPPSHL
jgi:hypothetical protein